MSTRLLMILSAFFTGAIGLTATFLPEETLAHFGSNPAALGVLLVKVAGALYLGYAILNWMARGSLIGGIYSRPVAMGNFMHFAVVAVVLSKAMIDGLRDFTIAAGLLAYSVFAVWFGVVLFKSPFRGEKVKA